MTAILIDNSIAAVSVSFSTALDALASSASLLAGAQSAKFDLGSANANLAYDVHAHIGGNAGAAPTVDTLCQLWLFASHDDTVYEGGGTITNAGAAAKTLTENEKAQGTLIFSKPWKAATSWFINVGPVALGIGRPGLLAAARYGVLWLTQNSGQALAALGSTVVLKPRNLV